MAQRKTDRAAIEQLKEMVLSLQEENAELLEALEQALERESLSLAREAAIAKAEAAATQTLKTYRVVFAQSILSTFEVSAPAAEAAEELAGQLYEQRNGIDSLEAHLPDFQCIGDGYDVAAVDETDEQP